MVNPVLSFTSSTSKASTRSWFSAAPEALNWLTSYWSGHNDDEVADGSRRLGGGRDADETEYEFFENRTLPDESSDEENDAKLWQDMVDSIRSWQQRKLSKHHR